MNRDDKNAVAALFAKGYSQEAVARHFDTNGTTISRWVAKWGLIRPKRVNPGDEKVQLMLAEGMNKTQIARKMGVTRQSIQQRCNRIKAGSDGAKL